LDKKKIIFLGEKFRVDAKLWYEGISIYEDFDWTFKEIASSDFWFGRVLNSFLLIVELIFERFKGSQYDILLAERSTSYGFLGLFVNARVKIVAQQGITDIYPITFFSKIFKTKLQLAAYTNFDLVHAWGHAMVPAMLSSNAHPSKIIVKPKGLPEYIKDMIVEPTDSDEIQLVVTRSLTADYNHIYLLKAVKILLSKGVKLHLHVIGDGYLADDLKTFAVNAKLTSSVTFYGRVQYEILPLILKKTNLYISVPISEGVSASLMEAMAVGLFPIVTDLPGNRALLKNGITGILVEKNSVEAIVEGIIHFKNMTSEAKKSAIKINKRWSDMNTNWHQNMSNFYDIYMTKLNQKQCAE
jgi:glycosyltransferase involved in cell wall biosynthesis